MEYHAIGKAEHELGRAKEVLLQLRRIRARTVQDVEAIRADETRTDEWKRTAERSLQDRAQNEAASILRAQETLKRLTEALEVASQYTPRAVSRRGRFTVGGDDQAEQMERLIAGVTLPREPLGDLSALCHDALATKRIGLAAAIAREAAFRSSTPGAGEAERHVARQLEEAVRAVEPAELQGATKVFDEVRNVRRLIENEFSAIGKPIPRTAKPVGGDSAVIGRLIEARRTA